MDAKFSVKAIRKNLKMTQSEMAEHLTKNNCPNCLTTYCHKENGKAAFSWDEIKVISKLSQVPVQMIE